jgi:putative ABC transport system ATP-binding protein
VTPINPDSLVLKATNLSKVYGSGDTEVHALRDVSLEVARGQIVALLGPSGAGKSTLLTVVGLILAPNAGRVEIGQKVVIDDGRWRVNVRRFRRENLGFVFQKANLIPFLTAAENVQLAMQINDEPAHSARKRTLELLDYLGVADRADHLPSQLSGGQQQRIAVARALANRPALILADEPTAALDSIRGRQVMDLFRRVAHEQHSGVIVVTHDHRALDIFDQTFEMEDGRLTQAAALAK